MKEKIDLAKLIKDRINILDIIGREEKLIKAGNNYKALCPFHDEKTPSFTINLQKQNYVCYGCGANGDAFSYLMEKYKLSFREALEKLAIEANINIKDYQYFNDSQKSRKENARYHTVMKHIASYYNLQSFIFNTILVSFLYVSQYLSCSKKPSRDEKFFELTNIFIM